MYLSFFVVISICLMLIGPLSLLHLVQLMLACSVRSCLAVFFPFNTRKDHILDLVLATCPDLVFSIHPCAWYWSWSWCQRWFYHPCWVLYNYSDIDLTHFKSVFSRTPWNVIDDNSDIELSWAMWKDLFLCALDLTTPKTKWKPRKLKHWFS